MARRESKGDNIKDGREASCGKLREATKETEETSYMEKKRDKRLGDWREVS